MIKFFRKIRKKMLTENKISRYVIYALGEIVLVVIGIIIALQLNNWNENRKQANNELHLYADLLHDLNSEYSKSDWHINRIDRIDKFFVHLFDEKNGDVKYDPGQNYNYLLWKHRYTTFIKEKYTEAFSTIKNKSIHSQLKIYLDQESDTNDAVEEWNEHQLKFVRTFLTAHSISNTKAMYNRDIKEFARIINTTNLVDNAKLEAQFKTDEFDQLLFTIRLKTLWVSQNFIWLNDFNRQLRMVLTNELALKGYEGDFEPILPKTIEELVLINKTPKEIIELLNRDINKDSVNNFTEVEINGYGYDLMSEGKNNESLEVFKINTQLYPEQWNTYDSYGENLLKIGDIENGVKAYKKSLELNPANSNAKQVLENFKIDE